MRICNNILSTWVTSNFCALLILSTFCFECLFYLVLLYVAEYGAQKVDSQLYAYSSFASEHA